MAIRYPTYFPQRVNQRVPFMAYDAQIQQGGHAYVEMGAPAAASTNGILNAQDIGSAGNTSTFATTYNPNNEQIMGRYGRAITIVAAAVGATGTVTVKGRDYLGQPLTEQLTLNGTTAVTGVKAFKYIDNIAWPANATHTMNVGWSTKLGLPYRLTVTAITNEFMNGANVTAGTLVLGNTGVQSATSTDPRGMYTPNTAPNGANVYTLVYMADQTNLHGNPHYYA
jgi:hypothetical protein